MTAKSFDLAVLGAGSWGTALAMRAARNGQRVALWSRRPEHVQQMAESRQNGRFLPDVEFADTLTPVEDFEAAVQASTDVLIACPSEGFVEVLARLVACRPAGQSVFWATKGFEPGSGRFLHELVVEQIDDAPFGILTGPSFAAEVARDLPTVVTVASPDLDAARTFADRFHGENFRVYTTDDLAGAEIGGAVKNVLAIATGVTDGMGLGHNARAALITRGLREVLRLGEALGARPETLNGLAGLGDLVLTCTGDLSRNRRFGLALGQGKNAEAAIEEIGQVVEGVNTAREVMRLARQYAVDMPIAEQTYAIIHEDRAPTEGLRRLFEREPKVEHET